MTTYRNKNFTKRDYEATNIVACVADEAPASPDGRWVVVDESILAGLTPLWTQAGVQYFGHM